MIWRHQFSDENDTLIRFGGTDVVTNCGFLNEVNVGPFRLLQAGISKSEVHIAML